MAKKEIGRASTADIPPFGLRMQSDLKALVEEAARANNRSMNAEIVSRLADSFDATAENQAAARAARPATPTEEALLHEMEALKRSVNRLVTAWTSESVAKKRAVK